MEGHWCKRVRAWTHSLFVCQCALREDETMSFRELGGACLAVLLAAATTIPAARRVTHSVVSFRSPISSTELCPAGSCLKAVVEPAVVWPEDTATRRVDTNFTSTMSPPARPASKSLHNMSLIFPFCAISPALPCLFAALRGLHDDHDIAGHLHTVHVSTTHRPRSPNRQPRSTCNNFCRIRLPAWLARFSSCGQLVQ